MISLSPSDIIPSIVCGFMVDTSISSISVSLRSVAGPPPVRWRSQMAEAFFFVLLLKSISCFLTCSIDRLPDMLIALKASVISWFALFLSDDVSSDENFKENFNIRNWSWNYATPIMSFYKFTLTFPSMISFLFLYDITRALTSSCIQFGARVFVDIFKTCVL